MRFGVIVPNMCKLSATHVCRLFIKYPACRSAYVMRHMPAQKLNMQRSPFRRINRKSHSFMHARDAIRSAGSVRGVVYQWSHTHSCALSRSLKREDSTTLETESIQRWTEKFDYSSFLTFFLEHDEDAVWYSVVRQTALNRCVGRARAKQIVTVLWAAHAHYLNMWFICYYSILMRLRTLALKVL